MSLGSVGDATYDAVPLAQLSTIRLAAGYVFLIWYLIILVVAYNGFFEILTKFKKAPNYDCDENTLEPVTIVRPIKGIDPELRSCLESSFNQRYPRDKIQILFCVDNPDDESVPLIKELIARHPEVNAEVLVSPGYDAAVGVSREHFGPNPKVNNLAKGVLKAKHDILWIMDSNVWALPNLLRNSVKALNENTNNGRANTNSRRIKLVHHVPIALSVGTQNSLQRNGRVAKKFGAQLDEMFLLTSHAKFYVSLNNLAIAPCVNGKSNVYRRSDLDLAVAKIPLSNSQFFYTDSVISDARSYSSLGTGNSLKLFAKYIGEDNMIAICLWENLFGRTGLTGDFVVQPSSGSDNTVKDYASRRVRWLRVRKYMVLLATLVEPTTESIVCGAFGSFAVATLLHHTYFSWKFFLVHMVVWMITDYTQYYTLVNNIGNENYQENWLKKSNLPPLTRPFSEWLYVWLMREFLALPIWISAMTGHEIDWRGRPFKIKNDLTAAEL